MAIIFLADSHWRHHNIIDYCGRPTNCDMQMWENLKVVRPDDVFIHCGDVGFYNSHSQAQEDFAKIPCETKILIVGNHDKRSKEVVRCKWTQVVWPKQQPFKIEYAGLRFAIQHRPFSHPRKHYRSLFWRWLDELLTRREPILPTDTDVIVHGHIHELGQRYRWREDKLVVNACVEHWGYKPFSIDEVVKEYHDRKQYYKNYRPRSGSRKH